VNPLIHIEQSWFEIGGHECELSRITVPGIEGLKLCLIQNPELDEHGLELLDSMDVVYGNEVEGSWTFEVEIELPGDGGKGFQGVDAQVDRWDRDSTLAAGVELAKRINSGQPLEGNWSGKIIAQADQETPAVVMAWGSLPEIGDVVVSSAHSKSAAQAITLLKTLVPGLQLAS